MNYDSKETEFSEKKSKLKRASTSNFAIFAASLTAVMVTVLLFFFFSYRTPRDSQLKTNEKSQTEINPGSGSHELETAPPELSPGPPHEAALETQTASETPGPSESNSAAQDSAGLIPGSELWFEDPGLRIEGSNVVFSEVPKILIDWDPTCAQHPFTRFDDLSVLTEKGLYIDPKDYFQSNHLAVQFTQFYRQNGQFLQFGYTWEQNSPQTYSIEAYSSSDKYMSKNVQRLQIKELSSDAKRRSGFFASQLQSYLRYKLTEILTANSKKVMRSGSPGARVALIQTSERISDRGQVENFEVSLRNSTVISVTNSKLNCRKSEKVNKSLCTCKKSE